ncbi:MULTISPECIES: OB-fold protein [Caproicibacterium]|uniref:Uncharacterized protein n=1 Tax=Caproicibacterium argilliputei TaxID=3030016 RepID=A0AA97D9T4_9FIRM|nr:hypothetical protein [Caproicibacterium argilliputei]WOC33245.1 hypothetical protein PXC00_05065 [Caproicibacterium argilliputei]
MGAYGSPEHLPPNNQNFSYTAGNPPPKKHTGQKVAYAVLFFLSAVFTLCTVSLLCGGYISTGILMAVETLGLMAATHMVHTNIDATNVANGIPTGRIYRKALNGYRSNGAVVNHLNPESAISYFRYHPIKMKSSGKIIAAVVAPFIVCLLISGILPYSSDTTQQVQAGIHLYSSTSPVSKTSTEAEYKASCKTIAFQQIARNPNKYKGQNVKLTATVQQIQDTGDGTQMLLLEADSDSEHTSDSSLYALYTPESENEDRILENDKITVYGVLNGLQTYTTVMGDSRSVPKINIRYRDILASSDSLDS